MASMVSILSKRSPRRWLTPAAFFLGLALICASLVEFARWTYAWHKLSSDRDADFSPTDE